MTTTRSSLAREVGVFTVSDLDELDRFFGEHGFAIVRGLYTQEQLQELEIELERQQQRLLVGELPIECGTVILDDPDAVIDGEPFAHYVCHLTEVSEIARTAVLQPTVVEVMTASSDPSAGCSRTTASASCTRTPVPAISRATPGSAGTPTSSRAPTSTCGRRSRSPSTSTPPHPATGSCASCPGSHLGGTDEMPLGFEHVPGEMAVYCERGDVLLHHSDLWHSAARATDDGEGAIRRHVRGGWYGGTRLEPDHGVGDFVKNARR